MQPSTQGHARWSLIVAAVGLIALVSLAGAWSPLAQAVPIKPGPLDPPTWSEEFDGDELDLDRWGYRHPADPDIKRGDGYLVRDAVSVGDGVLTIKTYTEDDKHYSAMISTQHDLSEGFEQKYGYFEARVKFNDSPGEWSAFWLQSRTIGDPKGDPTTAGVEMDIVEHRMQCTRPPGATASVCDSDVNVSDRINQALIWDGYDEKDKKSLGKFIDALDGLRNGTWHTYALSWTPTGLTFYYDDVVTWSVSGPISQRGQYIILSSEVGEFFAGNIPKDGYGSRMTTDTNMQVDYVRVWDTLRGSAVPANTTSPPASGRRAVGAMLRCSSGAWTGTPAPAFSYQWVSDGAPIEGASTPEFVVRRVDRGHALACRVTAANAAGSSTALSNALLIAAPLQRLGLEVRATIACAAGICRARAIRATATTVLRIPATRRTRASRLHAKAIPNISPDGFTVTARLRLAKDVRRTIRQALRARKPVVVTFSIRVLDSTGSTGVQTRQVGLRL